MRADHLALGPLAAGRLVLFLGLALACVGLPAAGSACEAPDESGPPVPASAAFERGVACDLGGDAAGGLLWYQRASAAELPEAQLNQAVMFDSGRAGPLRADLAVIWYAAAASHGVARAAYDVGLIYANGEGVPANDAIARDWLRIAAAGGLAAAAGRLREPWRETTVDALRLAAPVRPVDAALHPVDRSVALVWSAPAAPRAQGTVATFIEVVREDGGKQQEVYAGFVPATAFSVTLPPGNGTYAWRVSTVLPAGQRYEPSAWAHFTAEVPTSGERRLN